MVILVVSRDAMNRSLLKRALRTDVSRVIDATTVDEAIGILEDVQADVMWVDSYQLGVEPNNLVQRAHDMFPGLLTVLWTGTEIADPHLFNMVVEKGMELEPLREAVKRIETVLGD